MGQDEEFFYAIRLERDLSTQKPGQSAYSKADECAAETWSPRGRSASSDAALDAGRSWRMGAIGEEEVGRRLDSLPAPWRVLHDLPLGSRGANLDHLVIGPGGVFTFNSKCLSGSAWVAGRNFLHNGHRTDYVIKSEQEAKRVARSLSSAVRADIGVNPVIAVVGARLTIREMPRNVAVLSCRDVRSWVTSSPQKYDTSIVEKLARVARRPSTWGAGPPGGIIDRRPRGSVERRKR